MTFVRRIGPAILLAVLGPLVSEFLLADFTIRNLPVLVVLMPLYGGGALLIREVTRRTRRGWPSMLLLATAYAFLEEGFLTQSLFNPNYVGQRLLDYGYITWLGTSLNWCLFVLSIHIVWSIATPILIAEGVAADRRTEPWLKLPGLGITGLLFLLGCVSTTAFSLKSSPFVASTSQFVVVGLIVVVAVLCAFLVRPAPAVASRSSAPLPIVLFVVCLALAVIFMAAEGVLRGRGLPPAVSVVVRLACEGAAIGAIATSCRRRGWGALHYLALASATTLTYAVFGFVALSQGHTNLGAPTDSLDLIGQVVMAAAVFALIGWAAYRARPVR
jgi:hypothetical protein